MKVAAILALLLVSTRIGAQELEPRAYVPNPVGANFLLAGYGRSEGGVLFDASLPFSDVEAQLNSGTLAYGRTFALAGRAASLMLVAPYVWGDVAGNVGELREAITRSGLGDPRLRFSISLRGGEAMGPAEFMRRTRRTIVGASLTVVPPLGQYDATKLINIGSNRWSFKPELGVSVPVGRWLLEGAAGAWLFTANDDFYGGMRRTQDPLASTQLHVSYTFRPRLWIAADATYYTGGATRLDGSDRHDLQRNSRFGVTCSLPIAKRQSIKLSWATGVATRIGGDFDSYGLSWQYAWLSR